MARTNQQRQGGWAEQRALRLLLSRGWSLVARNWSCRWGELDLLVAKGNRLLLVNCLQSVLSCWHALVLNPSANEITQAARAGIAPETANG